MSLLHIRTQWDAVLSRVCYINNWEYKTRECWQTENGHWHSMNKVELRALEDTFSALRKMAKDIDRHRQWMLEANVLDFIKNILAWPSPEQKHREIMSNAWQLLFDLVYNSYNHTLIWIECNKILMKYLHQHFYDIDTCFHIVYSIYGIARVAQEEGIKILKILLDHFQKKKENGPLKEQGLTVFLRHFISDEMKIGSMYRELDAAEKSCFLHFIVDCISKPPVDGITEDCISSELLQCICNDFILQNEVNSASGPPQYSTVIQPLLELFEVIAYASTDPRHRLNKFDFRLLLNVVHLCNYVRSNDESVEQLFATIRRNSPQPLKEIILSTIINLVRNNDEHKEMARKADLIGILVEHISKEQCGYLYKCTLFALIDMCQTSPSNMEWVKENVKTREWTGKVSIKHFLYDMHYKGKRIY